MQIFATSPNLPQAAPARQTREAPRTIEPVVNLDDEPAGQDARSRLAPEQPLGSEPGPQPRDSENYRLNFDPEKRQIYLELLNPVTGDVIQRMPRDDLAFAFAPPEEPSFERVNLKV